MIEQTFDVGAGDAGLLLLRSAVIPDGFHHGFTTRRGGVSAPPFDTLNLGMKWGDARERVLENRRRLHAAAGAAAILVARQVHGANVVRVRARDVLADAVADIGQIEADGLYSDAASGLTIGVYVADCIPVLIADARTGAFAAVHAGWRGTVAGVVPAAVRRLVADLGARPQDLRVALGPAIGACCFEVGDEVVEAVARAIPAATAPAARAILTGAGGRAHVDLKRLNVMLLQAEGVDPAAIDAGPECTSCDRARFFSYRRDRGETGQAMGFIRVRAGAIT